MKQKRMLVIAYYFPPFGGIPVQRTLKFAKYLFKYGWDLTVLTVFNGYDHFHPNDPSLLRKIPNGAKVIRARELNLNARLIRLLRRKVTSTKDNSALDKGVAEKVVRLRKLLYNLLWFPDEKNLWIPFAIFAGLRFLSTEDVSVIYVSGYPWSAFLVGAFLSKLKGIPLVLDFRDAWTLEPRGLWDSPLHRFCEGKVLSLASKVIFATSLMREGYINRYSRLDSTKFITITNGFDQDDFSQSGGTARKDKRFLITYTGTFNDNIPPLDIDRSPYYFLKGFARLLSETSNKVSRDICARFVGSFGANNEYLVKQLGLDNVVEVIGHVAHNKSIEYQLEADLLLLVISPCCAQRSALTGKLFEYIGAKKMILALAPDGEARDLILREGLGMCVDPKDVDGIKDAILRLYEDWRRGGLRPRQDDSVFMKFEMQTLTRRLVEAIEDSI